MKIWKYCTKNREHKRIQHCSYRPEPVEVAVYVPDTVVWLNSVELEENTESWLGSTEYLAEMLIEAAQSWWVREEPPQAPTVNIEAEYPALTKHDEMEWPYSPTL